jgi:hypothetical protein
VEISHDTKIIGIGTKMCAFYMLDGSRVAQGFLESNCGRKTRFEMESSTSGTHRSIRAELGD